MKNYLVLTLNDDLKITNLEERKTDGLAHQLALRITDSGMRARIVDPENADEAMYLWGQVQEKRDIGYVKEFGHVPNGDRSHGEGARTIGRMIYEPLGIKLEGDGREVTSSGTSQAQPSPLALSSTKLESPSKKMYELKEQNITITLG